MTVNEAIGYLTTLRKSGFGESLLRTYSELSNESYPPVKMFLRQSSDNATKYDESYGTWIEVQ